jgi:hypothetical protein
LERDFGWRPWQSAKNGQDIVRLKRAFMSFAALKKCAGMHQSCLHFFLRKAKLGLAHSLEGVLLRLA